MWQVQLHSAVSEWLVDLLVTDPDSAELVRQAIEVLAERGPTLKRPMVDHIKGSRYHNMKELRPGSKGASEIRILFAFDPQRQAVLLVAGDKSGSWTRWYDTTISLADERYTEHLAALTANKEGRR